jgi:hypothetical protein
VRGKKESAFVLAMRRDAGGKREALMLLSAEYETERKTYYLAFLPLFKLAPMRFLEATRKLSLPNKIFNLINNGCAD